MLKTSSPVVIPLRSTEDLVRLESRSGHHLDKPRRRKSKDRNRMSAFWCASGQRSPTSSYDSAMPYDIPHLVRSAPVPPTSQQHPNGVLDHVMPKLASTSVDSGVDCKSSVGSVKEDPHPTYGPARPPSGCTRPSSSKTPAQRSQPEAQMADSDSPARSSNATVLSPKSRMSRSWSSFSLKTFAIRRKESPSRRLPIVKAEAMNDTTGTRMEQSRKRVGGSMPGDDRLNLSNTSTSADDEVLRKRTHTQMAERLSRLSRSFRRRRSTDRVNADLKHHDSTGDSTSSSSSTSSTSSNHQAIILYGTASRCRRSSFKLPISISPPSASDISSGTPPIPDRSGRKSGGDAVYPGIPSQQSLADGVQLVKILKLDQYMTNKWISGMAMSDKNELVLVDLREAYLIDESGNLIRTVGSKGSDRLVEPIGVSAGPDGRLVFTDHAQQNVKVFTNRGNHLRTITDFSLANIAGVACNRATGEIFVAGTDRKRVFVHRDGETRTIPPDRNSSLPPTSDGSRVSFKHPFSVAYNAFSGEVIVGDDYDQSVMGVTVEGQLMWRFCPPTHDGDRQFFPSSVCVDQDGMVFVADLYNGKVCMLDSKGQFVRTLLSRGFGLSGNPGAIATDGKGHILVADEERTVKVFQYKRTS